MNANWKNKQLGWLLVMLVLGFLASCQIGNSNQKATTTDSHAGHNPSKEADVYTCPMHPQIEQDKPGSCPICGMDLVKKVSSGSDSISVDASLKALLQPTNSAVVANIATVKPESRRIATSTQANGVVTYDTRRLYTIPARFEGRIEKLYVRYQYQAIHKGQKLLELYSPGIVTAQRELLYLLDADATNVSLISAAKEKLRLLGVSDGQINELIRTRKPSYSLAIFSPYDGYVVEETTPPASAQTPATGGGSSSGMGSGSGMGGGMSGASSAGTDEVVFDASKPTAGTASGALLLREGQYVQAGQTLF